MRRKGMSESTTIIIFGVTMGKCNPIGDVGGTKTALDVVYVDCGLACLID